MYCIEAHLCHLKKSLLVSHNYDLLSDNNDYLIIMTLYRLHTNSNTGTSNNLLVLKSTIYVPLSLFLTLPAYKKILNLANIGSLFSTLKWYFNLILDISTLFLNRITLDFLNHSPSLSEEEENWPVIHLGFFLVCYSDPCCPLLEFSVWCAVLLVYVHNSIADKLWTLWCMLMLC